MAHDATTIEGTCTARNARAAAEVRHLAWVLVWSRQEPERVGEVLLLPRSPGRAPIVIGRGQEAATWSRQRPGATIETGPLADAKVSRKQLSITLRDDGGVEVVNLGRGSLIDHQGTRTDSCVVRTGETCGIAGRALFLLTERPATMADISTFPRKYWPQFGGADAFGFVGESPEAWRLRESIGRIGGAAGHVLILGRSGSGKELAARAVHALSDHAKGPWVAHNAAAIPEGLVSAELFGNLRGYPNPGTPARPGLVGAANGGVLLLDEVGELSVAAQAALLRVLDGGGEYQRLGETRTRHSDVRVIGATNRDVGQLKADFAARFSVRLTVPTLQERLEDVPLVTRTLHETLDLGGALEMSFVRGLMSHELRDQVRSLRACLLDAECGSVGDSAAPRSEVQDLDAEALRTALAVHRGNREAAARALGLSSRFVLYRLMRRHGVED